MRLFVLDSPNTVNYRELRWQVNIKYTQDNAIFSPRALPSLWDGIVRQSVMRV